MDFLQTLALTVMLSAGYTPNYNIMYGDVYIESQERFTTKIALELTAADDLFFLGTSIKTQELRGDSFGEFAPIHEEYKVNTGVRFSGVEVGFERHCLHPVSSAMPEGKVTDPLYGSADTFYVKWSGKFRLFN